MNFESIYKQKLGTAEKAAAMVQSGAWLDYGWTTGTPVAFDHALACRMANDKSITDIKIRGGILLWLPKVLQLDDAAGRVCWNSWHSSGIERKLCATDVGFYAPLRYSELPRWYRENCNDTVDLAVFQVSPMDEDGFFNFGPNNSHLKAICDVAKTIVVEVNENLPYCNGIKEQGVHINDVTMIIHGDNPPMGEMPAAPAGEVEQAVAKLIVEEIPSGACLQLGIGGMPNAVGSLIAQSDLKDLGAHTEMFVDAYVAIDAAGKLTGAKKNIDTGKHVFAFAGGTQKLYNFIHKNPSVYSAPVDYTNDVRVVSQIDNFISINNAVDIDLFCQVNSESAGPKHISGAGGQMDFVMGAYLSKGGKSFICLSSTFHDKNGNLVSRIRPTLSDGSIVTDTRTQVHYVVTEYGKVNLKGLSTWQRAEALISIAHPQFRDQLISDANRLGIWRNSNKV